MPASLVLANGDQFYVEAKEDTAASELSLYICGMINEDVNFGPVLQFLGTVRNVVRCLAIDAAGVTTMNSCGVREWILFVERAQALLPCRFRAVSEALVEQSTLTMNVLGKPGTAIEMFQVPYYCEKCRSRALKTLAPRQIEVAPGSFAAPGFSCEKCGQNLLFDAVESEYFQFLKRHLPKP